MPTITEHIRRFETARLEDLKRVIRRPSQEEAAALKVWLGKDRYEILRQEALKSAKRRGANAPRQKVVVLHGIMGAELSVRNGKADDLVWVSLPRIAMGKISKLKMLQNGSPETDSYASNLMRKYYLEMLVGLGTDHDVEPFWYDWRLDLNDSAALLNQFVTSRFGASGPVHFVAHSMGGLVVRTWIKNHRKRWDQECRLIMLGTPNHGSFAIPQVITGAHKLVRKLALLDFHHNLPGFTGILNTFPGSCQMLPSPIVMESMEPLYRAATWQGRGVTQRLLDQALKHHEALSKVVDRERMLYIAGTGHHTASDFRDWSAMDRLDGYVFTPEGDETVPHRLGFLEDDGGRVPVRFSRASHGSLPNDPKVVAAVKQYLEDEEITALPEKQTLARMTRGLAAVAEVRVQWEKEIDEFAARIPVSTARGRTRKAAEIELEQEANLLSGFLGDDKPGTRGKGAGTDGDTPMSPLPESRRSAPPRSGKKVEIALHHEDIQYFGSQKKPGKFGPVDFLAAGHYQGVRPQWAELALDLRLSKALGLVPKSATTKSVNPSDLFITESTARGAVTMRLGEPYVLPVPGAGLSIALAGLGLPGTFGRAELAVMIQEFVVSLAKLGCNHLGTVLIGSGDDNMDLPTVSRVWLETLHSISASGLKVIPHITFVMIYATRIRELDEAFRALLQNNPELAETIDYHGPTISERSLDLRIDKEISEAEERRKQKKGSDSRAPKDVPPTFINIAKVRGGFEFSAITNNASIPLRVIKVDPAIIDKIGANLAENDDLIAQREWGTLLEKLLIPRDLRAKLFSSGAPVVFTVDSSAARIPWEMLRIPSTLPDSTDPDDLVGLKRVHPRQFLGSCEGFGVTRQLRTVFASAPEPPRGVRRNLKILIVADPAEDASLPGALEEAMAVAEIAEQLKSDLQVSGSDLMVKIETRIGPSEATREEILRLLTLERFDVLHFAGHCYFDQNDPAESGWIFHAGRNERITAAELSRLDCVPPFVFSNACESGITPDRSESSSLGLPPAFAEAFFERGVRNLICTAWPVGDAAALIFAKRFYEALLGLSVEFNCVPQTIRDAMLYARCKTIESDEGLATWGAYQHYGNPSFRFTR